MPWNDPHTWEVAKMFIIGAPFTVRPDNEEPRVWDMQRIFEKIIAGTITALIIGFGAWFMFVQDMKATQKLIQVELRNSIQTNEIAHKSIVDENKRAHAAIINEHTAEMGHIATDLSEIKSELRAFRNDFYIPNNGGRK